MVSPAERPEVALAEEAAPARDGERNDHTVADLEQNSYRFFFTGTDSTVTLSISGRYHIQRRFRRWMQSSRECGTEDSFYTRIRPVITMPGNTKMPKASRFAFESGVTPWDARSPVPAVAAERFPPQSMKVALRSDQGA
jgi:hypothetical protein